MLIIIANLAKFNKYKLFNRYIKYYNKQNNKINNL